MNKRLSKETKEEKVRYANTLRFISFWGILILTFMSAILYYQSGDKVVMVFAIILFALDFIWFLYNVDGWFYLK
jgi:hypothetical protein